MVRVAVAYMVTSWLVLQVADVVMENIGAPPWVMQALLFLIGVGLIAALIFAWVFELTPDGIKLETEISEGTSVVHQTRRKLDTVIIVLLVSAVAYLFWDGRLRESSPDPVVASDVGTVAEESAGLQRLRDQAATQDQKKSIAVLPFVNLSSDPEQEYFSDGISEELLNVLAQIPALRVAARTSSFQFKGDNRDISEIAELLKVNHVLEGSVRKAGTRLRITAQLIEADNGYHLWSETYDRELKDVFAIQDEISRAIADALRAELALDQSGQSLASRDKTNTPAYEAFLKGRALINQRGNEAITEGVRELERSVLLDPVYAPARAQLAIGIALLTSSSGTYGDLTLVEVNAQAGEQIEAAAALDDDFAELWAARSILANVNQDPARTLEFAERALAIRPNYADPLTWRVNSLADLGEPKRATVARDELLELDPLSVIGRLNAAGTVAFVEPERALALARSIAAQSPWASHVAQSRVYRVTGQDERQLEQLLLAYAISPADQLVNYDLAWFFVGFGLVDEGLRVSRIVRPWVLLAAGRLDEAELAFRAALAADPDNLEVNDGLAATRYLQGRFADAIEYWNKALIKTSAGEIVYSNGANGSSAFLADALRRNGEEKRASRVIEALDAFETELSESGYEGRYWHLGQAYIALLRDDHDAALESLKIAANGLLPLELEFGGIILDPLRDTPEFQIITQQVAQRAIERRKAVMQLICENNPVPNHWRPLEATCSGG